MFPCSLPEGGQAGPLNGVRVGADSWVRQERWLRWSAHSFGGVICRDLVKYPAFVPTPQKWQLDFGLFVSCCS